MLNKITFVLGIVAFILTSLQVWGFLPRNIPYALCILMIMEFMWGIKTFRGSFMWCVLLYMDFLMKRYDTKVLI